MLKRLGCRYNEKTKRYEPPSEPTIRRFLQTVEPHLLTRLYAVGSNLFLVMTQLQLTQKALGEHDRKMADQFICFLLSFTSKEWLWLNVKLKAQPMRLLLSPPC